MVDYSIKIILDEGSYKAIVLDMNKTANRLAYIAESTDKDLAYNEALNFVLSQGIDKSQIETESWH